MFELISKQFKVFKNKNKTAYLIKRIFEVRLVQIAVINTLLENEVAVSFTYFE